jgi:hypothetical protein
MDHKETVELLDTLLSDVQYAEQFCSDAKSNEAKAAKRGGWGMVQRVRKKPRRDARGAIDLSRLLGSELHWLARIGSFC